MAVAAAWAAVAVTAGSAVSQAGSAGDAANAARAGADAANPAAWMRPGFQDWIGDPNQPGSNWNRLSSPDSNDILKDPSFQFLQTEGERGVKNQNAAAFGSNRNGTYGEDMSKFNQGLASTYIDAQFRRNMTTLGMAGNAAGLTSGNPGVAGSLLAQGGQNEFNNMNNVWGQAGAGMQMWRNTAGGGGGTATPYFAYTGYDSAGGPAYG